MLKWIHEGVKPVFEGVKNTEPSKLNRVRGLFRHAVPKEQVEAYLKGEIPHEVTFQNHRSVYTHWPFTVDAVEKLVIAGTAHLYGPKEGRPKVVNPLAVALSADKERLVLNNMYPNAFMKQMPFKYERLRDILTFLKKGGFISSWDLKSGYFHVTIHPKYRTYFGFKIGDAFLHFDAVCFGWSQACFVFTVVMQEIFLEVRERAIPVSFYIDDGLTADGLYGRCLWSVVLIVKLLNYLGAYFGLPKCRLKPSQEGEWLGFEVILPEEIFRVSDRKMAKVRDTLIQCLESESVTPRQLAAVAGKLISLSPAVLPASIYSRALFQAMQGKVGWDELFPKPEEVKTTIEEWLNNLSEWNGRKWYAQPISLHVSSDASDFGFGGLVALPDGSQVPVLGSLAQEEIEMSSTAREVVGFQRLLESASRLFPEQIKDSTIQLVGDNQAAVLAINQFRSRSQDVTKALKGIFALCTSFDFSVTVVWKPRELLEAEDLLSRQPDASDWGISGKLFRQICSEFKVTIEIDLFASHDWHVAPRFVSLFHTPGSEASQALLRDWRLLVPTRAFAWIFPPVRLITEVIQLIERYRTNCILIVPEQPASNWWIHLLALPLAKPIECFEVRRGTNSCRPSRRVPVQTANPGLFKLRALRVEW